MRIERILAIKLADLGDLLLTEPALRSTRQAFPSARIDVLTSPASANLVRMLDRELQPIPFAKQELDTFNPRALLSGSATVGSLARNLRQARYDAVLIFHNLTTPAGATKFRWLAAVTGAPIVAGLDNGRGTFLTHRATDLGFGARHTVEYMLDVAATIGGDPVDPNPRIDLGSLPATITSIEFPEPFAAIFPVTGPFAPGRNWPVDRFRELATQLSIAGIRPVILGAADARSAALELGASGADSIDLTGRTSLTDMIHIVNAASVVVTGDSFPAHMAAALERPLVAIFGPSNHRAWGPYGAPEFPEISNRHSTIVRHDVPCAPCLYTGYRVGRRNGCGQRDCLTSITPDEVARAAFSVMDRHE